MAIVTQAWGWGGRVADPNSRTARFNRMGENCGPRVGVIQAGFQVSDTQPQCLSLCKDHPTHQPCPRRGEKDLQPLPRGPPVWSGPRARVKDTNSPAGPKGMGWGYGWTAPPLVSQQALTSAPCREGWGPSFAARGNSGLPTTHLPSSLPPRFPSEKAQLKKS